jgi:hypothetical protein
VEEAFRWIGFAVGVVLALGTVVGVMKTLIVPRRSWSLIPIFIGRNGYRLFHGIAVRLSSYDLADRFLGFLGPTVIIGILSAFLVSFWIAFALMLLPWADLTLGEAFRESGSSVFTLGFVSTAEPVPTTLDILAGATGMIFVALTIGYLPTLYSEIKRREALVKQLEGWTGVPSWGPEILARFALAGAVDRLPELYSSWDSWAAQVADTHLKYPVLTHFRLPRAGNHWLVALLAVMDAAALDLAVRPEHEDGAARLLLDQGAQCLAAVAYPMRRVDTASHGAGIDEEQFHHGFERMEAAGFPTADSVASAWRSFAAMRSHYAPRAYELAFWTIAAPAPWSGGRGGFPGLSAWPDAPQTWAIGAERPAGDPVAGG